MFKRILIANRGEIACRIIKTCHRLGIQTIAVGSTADEGALHMQLADEAVVIGPADACESYLKGEAIIQAAFQYGAEAIHPGYGFLSENPDFAASVQQAGLVFIGPSPSAIRAMGSKSEAKAIARNVNIPVIPGYEGDGDLLAAANQVGFPLLIKPAYGGGGKGMRLVTEAAAFEAALAASQREAHLAFGNDQVLLERMVNQARHVEVQILADRHGNCVALADRDCSLQRRHQKIIEEAPAHRLSDDLRHKLHEAAVKIAQAVAYEGAGTVEFLVEAADQYYFLEMNTRLQVEHPVTEMILGLDLVEWQLRIAAGEALPWKSEGIHPTGHAIEARLYAEDPDHHFLPSTGTLSQLDFPTQEHVRVDTGFQAGDAVTIFYDPLIAKIITWGQTRDLALAHLGQALSRTHVKGLKTNLAFLKNILTHPEVITAAPDIGFIDRYVAEAHKSPTSKEAYIAAALWLYDQRHGKSPWLNQDGWRLNAPSTCHFLFDENIEVILTISSQGIEVRCGEQICQAPLLPDATITLQGNEILVQFGQVFHCLKLGESSGENQANHHLSAATPQVFANSGTFRLTSPMPGRVTSVLVTLHEAVEANQPLLILEAMKMEHTIRAPHNGIVDYLPFGSGDVVEEGIELVRLR
jgi:3-methylcrotonyl-CoA carboxylase alpha subunit